MRFPALILIGCIAFTTGCVDRNESEYDTDYVIPPGVSLDPAPPMTGGLEQPGAIPPDTGADTVIDPAAPAAAETPVSTDTAPPPPPL